MKYNSVGVEGWRLEINDLPTISSSSIFYQKFTNESSVERRLSAALIGTEGSADNQITIKIFKNKVKKLIY
jgi:hypothetical protein